MIRVFIVEDNPKHLATIEAKVQGLGYQVVSANNNSAEAWLHFQKVAADVVLMDINLSRDEEGITLAGKMQREADVPIIYVTSMASDDIIRSAISTSPSGYLVKPIDPAELKANIELAVQKHKKPTAKPLEKPEYLTVRLGQKLQKVHFKNISHFKVESKNYVTLVDQKNRKFAIRGSIKKVIDQVLPEGFMRTHHSHGINVSYLEFIDEATQSIHLSTGAFIPIGKSYKKDVYEQMNIT